MLLLVQLIFTALMTGVIWAVQTVIYPMFIWLEPSHSLVYFKNYQKKISYLVIPLMTGEMLIACLLLAQEVNLFSIINLISILVIWMVTFLESVKRHQDLLRAYSPNVIKRLINGNWVRTAIWSFRLIALFCLSI